MPPLRISTYLIEITRNGTRYVKIGHTNQLRRRFSKYWSLGDVELVGYVCSDKASYEYLFKHCLQELGLQPVPGREHYALSDKEVIETTLQSIAIMMDEDYFVSVSL